MPLELFIVIVSLELLLALTMLVPTVLPGKFATKPTLGIYVWLLSFASGLALAGLAAGAAVRITVREYQALAAITIAETQLPRVLLASFAPWLLMAMVGVLLMLANIRLQGSVFAGSALESQVAMAADSGEWRSQKILITPVDVPIAGIFRGQILISRAVWALTPELRDAVLWHELAHVKLLHGPIRNLARLIRRLLPGVVASRVMVSEIDRLCELAADNWAGKRHDRAWLAEARKRFQEFLPTSLR